MLFNSDLSHQRPAIKALDLAQPRLAAPPARLQSAECDYFYSARTRQELATQQRLQPLDLAKYRGSSLRPHPVVAHRSIHELDLKRFHRVRAALCQIDMVAIVVPRSPNYGHQVACLSAFKQLRKLYAGPVTIYYPSDQTQKLAKLFPGFKEEFSPAGVNHVPALNVDFICVDACSTRLDGRTSAIALYPARDKKLPTSEELAELGVQAGLVLQPYGWRLFSAGIVRSLSERPGAACRSETIDLPPFASYQVETLPPHDKSDAIPALETLLSEVAAGSCNLMPVYGLHHLAVDAKRVVQSLISGLRELQVAERSSKPTVLLLLSLPHFDAAAVKSMRRMLDKQFVYLGSREWDSTFRLWLDSQSMHPLVVCKEDLPPAIFQRCFQYATLPAAIEGSNTANLCLALNIPYFSVRSDIGLDYIYGPEIIGVEGRKQRGREAAVQMSASLRRADGATATQVAQFIKQVANPNSVVSRYFRTQSRAVLSSENDQLLYGLDKLLNET